MHLSLKSRLDFVVPLLYHLQDYFDKIMKDHYTVSGNYNGTKIRRLIKVKEDLTIDGVTPDYMMGYDHLKHHWYTEKGFDKRNYTYGFKKCFVPLRSVARKIQSVLLLKRCRSCHFRQRTCSIKQLHVSN